MGYLDFIRSQVGTDCGNDYQDDKEALGPPNATLLDNYLSLGGGFLTGEFKNQFAVLALDTITVYEVGSGIGGIDEAYNLHLAREMSCGGSGTPTTDCTHLIGDGQGEATFTLPASAF